MSQMPLGNMMMRLTIDDAAFGKGVTNAKKQVKYLAKEMQANMKISNLAGNQLGMLGEKYSGLTRIIQAQEKQVMSLSDSYNKSFVDGKATKSTANLATQLQSANGQLANYKKQLIDTAGAYTELETKTAGVTGVINKTSDVLQKVGNSAQNIGTSLTHGVTIPIAGAVTAVTTAAVKWESAFAGVKKTNDEIVDSNGNVVYSYSDLEKGLRDLAKELPSSHEEIAGVAEAAGQLGIQTDNVVSFTKTMIDLGEST
ncbi:phage tail tape measure protein, partial [Enterococcus hirae]|nr:phage tail tape measure protein [Enterococcus hirae]